MTAIIIIFTIIIFAALIWCIIILEADIDTYKYQMRFQDQRIRNLYRLLLPSDRIPSDTSDHSDKIRHAVNEPQKPSTPLPTRDGLGERLPIGAKLEQDGTM